ncbi:hypothetical protein [Thermogemmatispora carboxidivorans]|uniref:hypothetical protein n=1 Tax=Thermogemmatispora carboxidivorans TaxID=1382306 RepID=UPI00138DE872
MTLVNISDSEQEVAASFNFTLRDTEGREIEMAFVDFASRRRPARWSRSRRFAGPCPMRFHRVSMTLSSPSRILWRVASSSGISMFEIAGRGVAAWLIATWLS